MAASILHQLENTLRISSGFLPVSIDTIIIKNVHVPWLVWLSGLSAVLQIEGLPVRFPVRAHAWVASQGERQPIDVSRIDVSPFLPPSFPLSLKIKK